MRRRKVEITEDLKETVNLITSLIPNDVKEVQQQIDEVNDIVKDLSKMKHTDYIKSRKILLEISRKCIEMRSTILQTHKLFTEEIK